MARKYIELKTAEEELLRIYDLLTDYPTTFYEGFMFAKFCISDIPTADVVEVVRCKDCVSNENCDNMYYHEPDDFCSCGIRRKSDAT